MRSIKLVFSSLLIAFMAFTCTACQNNSNTDNSQSSNSTTTQENKSSESADSKTSDEDIKLNINVSDIWTKEESSKAEEYAKIVIKTVKNKDINALSDMIAYPISLGIDDKDVKVNNKNELLTLDANKVLTEDLIKEVSSTNELFGNQYGFMVGAPYSIWFSPMEDGNMKITQIINP